MSDFVKWNGWIGSESSCGTDLYGGIDGSEQRPVCVGVDGGSAPITSGSTRPPAPTTTTAMPTTATVNPGPPTQTGLVSGCRKYHVAESGDGCWAIANNNNIRLDDFYSWNPAVGTDCLNLWPGYAYCILGPAASSPSSSTAATTTSGGVSPPGPTQDGANPACKRWHMVVSGDGCPAIQETYNVPDFATLLRWNPSIGSNCENLGLGYSLCVAA